MSERDAFELAIRTNPADETARLVFADWLDENGYEGWAYLIRHGSNPTVCPMGLSADVMFYRKDMEGSCTVKLAEGIKGVQFSVVNGFVWSVHCTLNVFISNAKKLFAAHPIESVTLTDRFPHRNGPNTFAWFCRPGIDRPTNAYGIPPEFRHFMGNERKRKSNDRTRLDKRVRRFTFRTTGCAQLALLECCVDYGRFLVGLPRLYTEPAGVTP